MASAKIACAVSLHLLFTPRQRVLGTVYGDWSHGGLLASHDPLQPDCHAIEILTGRVLNTPFVPLCLGVRIRRPYHFPSGVSLVACPESPCMFSSVYFAVLPLLGALVRGYADPGRCTGACNVRDPGLVQREDGMYFLFSTHEKIKYASAKSLSGPWTMVGSVVPDGSKIDLSGRNDLWVS